MGIQVEFGVIGAGYVGLVAAACFATLGHRVVCVDIDAERIERLRRGEVPIVEPKLDELVALGLAQGRLIFTTDMAALHGTDLVMVAVGTLDASGAWTDALVRRVVLDIAQDPSAPRSIVIRSTLLPGTAARLASEAATVDPAIELAVNPEFTREGSAVADFLRPDRVVIGTNQPTGTQVRALRQIYEPLDARVIVSDLTSAEMIKLASNVFLATKITFANELARLCESTGASVADVVDGIGLDSRIGRAFLSPGPGYGGSCLPAQSRALPELAARSGTTTPLIDAVSLSNDRQTGWLIELAEKKLGRTLKEARVAVLGLTFKAGTDDLRDSPALRLVAALADQGAFICAHDPIATRRAAALLARGGVEIHQAPSAVEACRAADVVFIATEWPDYADLDWREVGLVMAGDCVVDSRAILSVARAEAAGLRVVGLPRRASHHDSRQALSEIADDTAEQDDRLQTPAAASGPELDQLLPTG